MPSVMKVDRIHAAQHGRPSAAFDRQFFDVPVLNFLLLIVIVNFALQPLTEPDFGWHLRTGLDMLHNGLSLPDRDPYSHTMPDWAWVEHAWLTDVLIGAIYSLGGGLGVILLFALVTISAWLIASATSRAGVVFRRLACAISLWVALPYLGARTQLVTLLGLALLLFLLKRWQDGVPICPMVDSAAVFRLGESPRRLFGWAHGLGTDHRHDRNHQMVVRATHRLRAGV